MEAINRVSRLITETNAPKSYTYTIGLADEHESFVATEQEAEFVAHNLDATRTVSATEAYNGAAGSLVRRHNSLFVVHVKRRNGEPVETFTAWLGNDRSPAKRFSLSR